MSIVLLLIAGATSLVAEYRSPGQWTFWRWVAFSCGVAAVTFPTVSALWLKRRDRTEAVAGRK